MLKKVFCLLIIVGCTTAFAEQRSQPASFSYSVKPIQSIDHRSMPAVDARMLEAEDLQREEGGLPPRFARPIAVNLNPVNSGTWEKLNGDGWVWRLRISSVGALSLNFGFTRYHMPQGGTLLIYPSTYNTNSNPNLIRTFTDRDNEEHQQLWTPIIFGDDVILEALVPMESRHALRLQLSVVNHDYKGFGRMRDRIVSAGVSGSCNIDVVCPEGDSWRNQIKSVGVISVGGNLFCSGSLINNTAEDRKMYFITAYHCGVNARKAPSLVVYWNYQNSVCRSPGSTANAIDGDGTLNHFQTGSYLRAGFKDTDFTLLELDDPPSPAFHVYWAGWDRSTGSFASAASVHHPNTAEKRITLANSHTVTTSYYGHASPGDGTHLHVFWAPGKGVTEPGSSGSPLYNGHGRFIGQLHGGPSACTASDKSDYFGRFSVSWEGGRRKSKRLRDWLDPLNTGAITLNGLQ